MKELRLKQGEKAVFKLEGDVYGGGSNPISQAMAKVRATIGKIFGIRIKATLVVTNKRVIMYQENVTCYCVPAGRQMKVIMPSSVMEVGYSRITSCGCFPFYQFQFQGHTEKANFPVKGGNDKMLTDYVSKFYAAITAAAK